MLFRSDDPAVRGNYANVLKLAGRREAALAEYDALLARHEPINLMRIRPADQSHARMVAAIQRAEEQILLEMYWISDDPVGRAFRDALVLKARQGLASNGVLGVC